MLGRLGRYGAETEGSEVGEESEEFFEEGHGPEMEILLLSEGGGLGGVDAVETFAVVGGLFCG